MHLRKLSHPIWYSHCKREWLSLNAGTEILYAIFYFPSCNRTNSGYSRSLLTTFALSTLLLSLGGTGRLALLLCLLSVARNEIKQRLRSFFGCETLFAISSLKDHQSAKPAPRSLPQTTPMEKTHLLRARNDFGIPTPTESSSEPLQPTSLILFHIRQFLTARVPQRVVLRVLI